MQHSIKRKHLSKMFSGEDLTEGHKKLINRKRNLKMTKNDAKGKIEELKAEGPSSSQKSLSSRRQKLF